MWEEVYGNSVPPAPCFCKSKTAVHNKICYLPPSPLPPQKKTKKKRHSCMDRHTRAKRESPTVHGSLVNYKLHRVFWILDGERMVELTGEPSGIYEFATHLT